jgi:hypothetical protein
MVPGVLLPLLVVLSGAEPRHVGWSNGSTWDCVATAADGRLEIEFAIHGCFGGTRSSLVLDVKHGVATLSGRLEAGLDPPVTTARVLSSQERHELMAELGERMGRAEVPNGCFSTALYDVKLKWTCGGASESNRFQSSQCEPEEKWPLLRPAEAPAYARAIGLYRAAERAVRARSVDGGAP